MSNSECTPKIPGFSLARQNNALREELLAAIAAVIDKGNFILGENVQALEQEIAAYCDAAHAIGVANGSDALYLSLLACGIGQGDEVITTPFTFFATAGSIERVGARPVFVDIDPDTWNIDVSLIQEKITHRTKAVIPVHLYGHSVDMDPLMEIAAKNNLKIIEDCAQALGAKYKGKKVGAIGDLGCISFFPTKNLGAFGDGGMVVTDNTELADKVRLLRVHGSKPKYYHNILGCNSRLDELQAAILRVKFPLLPEWEMRRRAVADLYSGLLAKTPVRLPLAADYTFNVFHQYTIQTGKRDELKAYLEQRGISSTVYYPLPMHLQKVFAHLGYRAGDFPIAEKACAEVLSLPMYPELTDDEAARVANAVVDFFAI